MTLRLREVMKVCMNHPGMWDDFLRAGQLDSTREFLKIDRPRFDAINKKFFDGGLGSFLHEVIKPAVWLADSILGSNLTDCGECGERELKLNDATNR